MAGQNQNGLIVTLTVFVVIAVACLIGMYMVGNTNSQLTQQLADKTKEAADNGASLQDHISQLDSLKTKVGVTGADTAAIVEAITKKLAENVKDGASTDQTLDGGFLKTVIDRNQNEFTSTDRQSQLNQKTLELQQTIQRLNGEIKSHQDAAARAEGTLRQKETQHSEELASRQKQIDDTRAELGTLQSEYNTFKTQMNRQIEDLNSDIADKRQAIVVLRQKLFEQEDISFDKADGLLTFVDQDQLKCYLNLGKRDELQVGTTFSVYTKSNSGVGRRNTEDVKGKIEVVSIMGPHQAEARIVQQDLGRPLATDDPIYSPLFASGQKLEIAVAGLLDFDGNPGADTDEFRRIVSGAGARISIRTNDVGELVDMENTALTVDDIRSRITEKTRFLVMAETGEGVETEDPTRQAIYRKIQTNAEKMKEGALNNGVYVISLSNFLEYIGYSRKRLAWSPTAPFPAKLPNGAKSSSVGAGLGQRASSAAISGSFSSRRKSTATSTGRTSSLYDQQ